MPKKKALKMLVREIVQIKINAKESTMLVQYSTFFIV